MKFTNKNIILVLGVLIVAVIILGVRLMVLNTKNSEISPPVSVVTTPSPIAPGVQIPPSTPPVSTEVVAPLYPPKETVASKISASELNAIILAVGDKPTSEDIKQYSVSLGNVLVDSPNLDATGCTMTPNVLHLKLGQSITVSNGDDTVHQINYGQTNLSVAGKSKQPTTFAFVSPGNYPYRCDQSRDFAGVFLVTP